MTVNYQTGEVFPNKASGILTHSSAAQGEKIQFKDGETVLFESDGENEDLSRVPVCPNGLNAMQYTDGRPVMCLPGRNQCPENSSCYFNGMDFFCCPNNDDPYDMHVFGG